MDTMVFAAVLAAAAFHAGWNSLIKGGADRSLAAVVQMIAQATLVLPMLPFAELPSAASWPWLIGSVFLHISYKLFLIQSYSRCDLSQAYPLSRGSAPAMVAIFSAAVLGVTLGGREIAAIALVSAGVLSMALLGSGRMRMSGTALFCVLGTAIFTAAYTLVDGTGARLSGTVSGYIFWMTVIDGSLMVILFSRLRGFAAVKSAAISGWKPGLAAGAMSLASYWTAVWAFTRAPIALVAALRESSILFAVIIAALFMGEKVSRWRWISALAIAVGVILMKI